MEQSPKEMKISDERVDRISILPDDVLYKIISYLYLFDGLGLSVLSKKWRHIWRTNPYLDFDFGGFNVQTRGNLKDFINWILTSQSSNEIVRFLLCSAQFFNSITILRWLSGLTAKRNVKELVLCFDPNEAFQLPCCLATSQYLRVLKLNLFGCVLTLPNHLGFQHLKCLHLEQLGLQNQHLINCILSKSHLEKLILKECYLENIILLDIVSESLVYVDVQSDIDVMDSYKDCQIKLACPKLKFFKYYAPEPKDLTMESGSSVESLLVFFIDMHSRFAKIGRLVCEMIKAARSSSNLKLCRISITGLTSVGSPQVWFSKLKSLDLTVAVDEGCMQVMMSLLNHSPNLKVLKLFCEEDDLEGQTEFKDWKMGSFVCLESHLEDVQLAGFNDEENQKELVKFFLENAHVLEKLTIFWDSEAERSKQTEEEVGNFPKSSSKVVLTFLEAKRLPTPGKWYDYRY